jgi:hypothetical protein
MRLPEAISAGVALCIIVPGVCSAAADDPQETYDALFGKEARKVALSAGTKDDAAFAAKLLAAARTVPDAPKLQELLLVKAYEFGLRDTEGQQSAIDAMELLAATFPARQAEAQEKVLELRRRQYRYCPRAMRTEYGRVLIEALERLAGTRLASRKAAEALLLYRDAARVAARLSLPIEAKRVAGRIEIAEAQEAQDREIASLERRHQAVPANQDIARKLLRAYLVYWNDPARALPLLEKIGPDEVLRTYLPLAARGLHDVPPAACLELGNWYATLAGDASSASRRALLLRELGYYERFCDLHGREDASLVKAQLRIAGLAATLGEPRAGKVVSIAAGSEEGYVIGPVRPNTRIALAYVSGTWRSWEQKPKDPADKADKPDTKSGPESPDDPQAEHGDACRLVLAEYSDPKQTSRILAVVPPGTAKKPFVFFVSRQIPKLILRIHDADGDYKGTQGSARYRLRVTRYF